MRPQHLQQAAHDPAQKQILTLTRRPPHPPKVAANPVRQPVLQMLAGLPHPPKVKPIMKSAVREHHQESHLDPVLQSQSIWIIQQKLCIPPSRKDNHILSWTWCHPCRKGAASAYSDNEVLTRTKNSGRDKLKCMYPIKDFSSWKWTHEHLSKKIKG